MIVLIINWFSYFETCCWARLSVHLEAGQNLTSGHRNTCPADILIPHWCMLSVTLPLNQEVLWEVGLTAGAGATATEIRKRDNDVQSWDGWCPCAKCAELVWGVFLWCLGDRSYGLMPCDDFGKIQICSTAWHLWATKSAPCEIKHPHHAYNLIFLGTKGASCLIVRVYMLCKY